MKRLHSALNNAHDAQEALGSKNIEIEIVVFGAGVNTLKHQASIPNADKAQIIADKVKEAKEAGVRIVACDSTMQLLKLHPSDLLPEVQYVKSGVIELIEKQAEGWSYVRPWMNGEWWIICKKNQYQRIEYE